MPYVGGGDGQCCAGNIPHQLRQGCLVGVLGWRLFVVEVDVGRARVHLHRLRPRATAMGILLCSAAFPKAAAELAKLAPPQVATAVASGPLENNLQGQPVWTDMQNAGPRSV